MVKAEELDQLRCEITPIPTRHYNHAARAIELAQRILDERDNLIAWAKNRLMIAGCSEKDALANIFRALNTKKEKPVKPQSPYE